MDKLKRTSDLKRIPVSFVFCGLGSIMGISQWRVFFQSVKFRNILLYFLSYTWCPFFISNYNMKWQLAFPLIRIFSVVALYDHFSFLNFYNQVLPSEKIVKYKQGNKILTKVNVSQILFYYIIRYWFVKFTWVSLSTSY